MKINYIFLSINAPDFAAQSDWWSRLIGHRWDREPRPTCHEWDLTKDSADVLQRTNWLVGRWVPWTQ